MFDSRTLPARDAGGYTKHPDFAKLEPARDFKEALRKAGFTFCCVSMEFDAPEEVYFRHFIANTPATCDWTPTPPGPNWRLVAIIDCEDDGPHAVFITQAEKRAARDELKEAA